MSPQISWPDRSGAASWSRSRKGLWFIEESGPSWAIRGKSPFAGVCRSWVMLRRCVVLTGLLAAFPASAGEMSATEARHFIVGKMFHYTCFEGTRGQGRIYPDGSVAGSIQVRGSGSMRYAVLPPG